MIFDHERPDGIVAGARLSFPDPQDKRLSAKGVININSGDILEFQSDFYSRDGQYQGRRRLGEGLLVQDGLQVGRERLQGHYNFKAVCGLTDIYGSQYRIEAPQSP